MNAWPWQMYSNISERTNEWMNASVCIFQSTKHHLNHATSRWDLHRAKTPIFSLVLLFLRVETMLSWALRLKPSSLSEAGPKALPLLTCTCLPDITVLVVNSGVIPVKTHFILSKWYSLSLGVYLMLHCICSFIQIASIHEWMPPIENGKLNSVLSSPSISLAPNFTFQMLSLFN